MAMIDCETFYLAQYLYIIKNNSNMERMNGKKEK